MKRFLLLLSLFASAVATASAQGESQLGARPYLQPSAWLAVLGDDFEVAGGGGLAAGFQFGERHRGELEVGFFDAEVKEASYSMRFVPVLLGYKYSLPVAERVSIYGGLMAGAMFQEVNFKGSGYLRGETKSGFTAGLTGGVRVALSTRLSLDAGTKLLRVQKTKLTTEGNIGLWYVGLGVAL